ncbi:MAG: BLUF domain-containing protein [Gammaproteobacteria bacterium]|nr:MAG: BLUF domain-containing protein [Gammaproteobacteria bacterium]
MTDLLSIIYVSTALNPFIDEELDALLADARAFNKERAITGVLLYADGNFMQCLEGPADSVLRAYDRILASHRHKGLIELNRSEIESRSFDSWEMGLLRPTKAEFISISNAVSLASPKDHSSVIAIEFMKSFINTMGAAK